MVRVDLKEWDDSLPHSCVPIPTDFILKLEQLVADILVKGSLRGHVPSEVVSIEVSIDLRYLTRTAT